jgi:hypothetical protein
MALTLNPNSPENRNFLAKQGKADSASPLHEIAKNMPTFLPKEKTAGLGSTHHVTTESENQIQLEAFERAKKDAREGRLTGQDIQDYGIKDQYMLFEIAKIIAAHSGKGISQFIKNFDITDPNMLFEIAKIAAAQDGRGTSQYIKNYGIKDQDMLFKIAKIAAAQSGEGIGYFIQDYRDLGLKDQKMLFEIAKIAAAQSGTGTSQWIRNYGIKDQDMLFEIAKIAVAQSGRGTSRHIQNYDIQDQDKLFEIAKIAAAHNGEGISLFIKNYRLKDQNMLFEIAKIAAAQDGEGTSHNIQNYGITDQNMLFEIAKIAAAQDGEGTSFNIQNYDIKDQNMRFEIAKISAAQNGLITSQAIRYYDLSEDQQLQILQLGLAQVTSVALETSSFYFLLEFAKSQTPPFKERLFDGVAQICAMTIPLHFKTAEEKNKVEKDLKEAFNLLKDFAIQYGASNKILASFEETIFTKHTSLQQQQKDLLWLGAWIMHYSLDPANETLKKSPLCDAEMIPLLDCILKTIDPNLRNQATSALKADYNDPQKLKSLKKLMGQLDDERLYLIALFSTLAGIETKMTKRVCDELPKTKYKDAKLMAPINELMCALYKSCSLSPEEKERLLGLIFSHPPVKGERESKPEFSKRLDEYRKSRQNWIAAVHSLLYFSLEESLKNITNTTELVSQWQVFMGKTFYIKADILNKFFPTFGNSKRCPNGLFTYAARLQTLPKAERDVLMPLLGKFANAVLDGTFPKVRYSFADNPHLKAIFSGNEELLKKWQTPFPIIQVQTLMRNALAYRHLGADQDAKYPELKAILDGTFKDADEGIVRNCAIVLNPETALPELKSAVIELQKLFPSADVQFHHDLKEMMATLDPNPSELFTIEDTDAWEDFLMMGTEVFDSCQNIQGDPALNKCLLSPFGDGKNRLMDATERSSGKILGRIVFRVHPDTNNNLVLFVEKLYTRRGVDEKRIRQKILEGCKQKAQTMGIALTVSASDNSALNANKYPHALKSLGGPAPYEYVDALHGIQKNGIYSIPVSYLLWSPSM